MDKLKYSDLLLLGSTQVKQAYRAFIKFNPEGTVKEACAIGMMAIGRSGHNVKDSYSYYGPGQFNDVLQELRTELLAQLVYTRNEKMHLHCWITRMNDVDHKTPAEIAEALKEKGF